MLTYSQWRALLLLKQRHDGYPDRANFPTAHLGASTASMLRKLSAIGLANVTKGGRGTRQFFSITDAGRRAIEDAE